MRIREPVSHTVQGDSLKLDTRCSGLQQHPVSHPGTVNIDPRTNKVFIGWLFGALGGGGGHSHRDGDSFVAPISNYNGIVVPTSAANTRAKFRGLMPTRSASAATDRSSAR